MKLSLLLFAAPVGALLAQGCATARAADPVAASEREVELLVYKDDFAMVKEARPVELKQGRSGLRLNLVSNSLDPNSVMIDLGKSAKVVSTTFDLGVGDQSNMMQRLSGREVELMLPSDNGSEGKTIKGILEPNAGGFLLRTPDKLYVNPNGTIIADSSSDVATMPQLAAEVDSQAGGKQKMDLTYLTRGLKWSADYIAKLDSNDNLTLELWATVTNKTGIRYPEAKISFVAGSPNRAVMAAKERQDTTLDFGGSYGVSVTRGTLDGLYINDRATGELYAYKAPAPASIGIDQMSRVPMMEPASVPIKKDYSVTLEPLYPYAYNQSRRISAQLAIRFKNDQPSHLGVPLPAGAVRVYSSGDEGSAYVGAATISDTPKNAPVFLTLSKVFDVYAEPKTVSIQKVKKHTVRVTSSTTLHNEKKGPVTVRIVQPIYASWKPVSESHPSKKLNANTREWRVSVPPGGEVELKTTVEMKV